MFDSTHKENVKKTRQINTLIVDTKKLCLKILKGHRDRTKNYPEVEKVLLLIREIF